MNKRELKQLQAEIGDGNIVIAEFMGAMVCGEEYDLYSCPDMNYVFEDVEPDDPEAKHFFKPNEMLFHSSLDWLTPVIKKIKNQGYKLWVNIGSDECFIYIPGDGKFVSDLNISTKIVDNDLIMAVWRTVVKYINWHNLPF